MTMSYFSFPVLITKLKNAFLKSSDTAHNQMFVCFPFTELSRPKQNSFSACVLQKMTNIFATFQKMGFCPILLVPGTKQGERFQIWNQQQGKIAKNIDVTNGIYSTAVCTGCLKAPYRRLEFRDDHKYSLSLSQILRVPEFGII